MRSVELSIAAKITRVLSSDGSGGHRPGYGAKIGDFSGGSWMDYDPQKHEAKVRDLTRWHGWCSLRVRSRRDLGDCSVHQALAGVET